MNRVAPTEADRQHVLAAILAAGVNPTLVIDGPARVIHSAGVSIKAVAVGAGKVRFEVRRTRRRK